MSAKLQLDKIYNHAFKSTDVFGFFTCIWQGSPQPNSFISECVCVHASMHIMKFNYICLYLVVLITCDC